MDVSQWLWKETQTKKTELQNGLKILCFYIWGIIGFVFPASLNADMEASHLILFLKTIRIHGCWIDDKSTW